jgi:hypothetical protein
MLSHNYVSTCTTSVFFLGGGGVELFPLVDLTKNPSASHQRNFLGKKWVKLPRLGGSLFGHF